MLTTIFVKWKVKEINRVHVNCEFCRGFCMKVETVGNLKRMLKEMGYSDKAVEEILKWYKGNKVKA